MLCGDDVADGDTSAKCAPPLRSREQVERLWQRVLELQPAIVSDHSPAPPETKAIDSGSIREAWGGISSLGLQLPLLATGLLEHGIDGDELLMRLVRQLAVEPARIAGLDDRGAIAPGLRADLVELDLAASWTIHGVEVGWRWPRTPYEGRVVRGRAARTWVSGRRV
jgi:allantoinase